MRCSKSSDLKFETNTVRSWTVWTKQTSIFLQDCHHIASTTGPQQKRSGKSQCSWLLIPKRCSCLQLAYPLCPPLIGERWSGISYSKVSSLPRKQMPIPLLLVIWSSSLPGDAILVLGRRRILGLCGSVTCAKTAKTLLVSKERHIMKNITSPQPLLSAYKDSISFQEASNTKVSNEQWQAPERWMTSSFSWVFLTFFSSSLFNKNNPKNLPVAEPKRTSFAEDCHLWCQWK